MIIRKITFTAICVFCFSQDLKALDKRLELLIDGYEESLEVVENIADKYHLSFCKNGMVSEIITGRPKYACEYFWGRTGGNYPIPLPPETTLKKFGYVSGSFGGSIDAMNGLTLFSLPKIVNNRRFLQALDGDKVGCEFFAQYERKPSTYSKEFDGVRKRNQISSVFQFLVFYHMKRENIQINSASDIFEQYFHYNGHQPSDQAYYERYKKKIVEYLRDYIIVTGVAGVFWINEIDGVLDFANQVTIFKNYEFQPLIFRKEKQNEVVDAIKFALDYCKSKD